MSVNTTSHGLQVRTFDVPRNQDGSVARVVDYYGCNVFDLKAMAKKLSNQDVETIARVMKFGGRIDAGLAERVAASARQWAIEKGATHYCHWFQPQTGATAEKHDCFLWFDRSGNPIERFTGRELLQGEPDASSFPSGGIRSTFEARGYTGWDPSSPMFLVEAENGRTLYIPSVFLSYHGEALDLKIPLLRSNDALSTAATRLLHTLGEKAVTGVTTNLGLEQEFFVVDRHLALRRPDLTLTGRSVFGKMPAKGQELEDHYFAHIPSRVQAYLNELEIELYKLGVPVKTRHNEVAPCQFEIAPIFEGANVACDHNLLLMKMLRTVASRHGFMVLLNEKPFQGVNGSGKHANWSIADSTGRNLLDPGQTPHENIVFLTFLAATLWGIHDHADVLRASIASAGNDHRLGANEAPPAIISAFLGEMLDKILTAIEVGQTHTASAEKAMIELGVSHLQELLKDNTDRNRTSPFAFTGNKFEFRAVGSSASVGYPVSILNAAVASGCAKMADLIQAKSKGGTISADGALAVIREVVTKTKKIRFEGNGYSQEWRDEAAKRGLSNFPTTPEALDVFNDKAKVAFLTETKVMSNADVESRQAVQFERYIKQRLIEINVGIEMVQTGVLPASMSYLSLLMGVAKDGAALQVSSPALRLAQEMGAQCARVETALIALKTTLDKVTSGDAMDHHHLSKTATAIAVQLMPKLEDLRTAVDTLEGLVPSDKWPFPHYQDLLFGFE